VTVVLGRGKHWNPGNSDGRSHGMVRLLDALASSYNQATVRLGMEVAPERIAALLKTLAGIEVEPNPALILGSLDQSPYAMAQLYQFLASGGEIQPLHAVRGVLDANGRALNRYDKAPAPAQEGDAIAARLITIALQQAVSGGTGRQLVTDGLGRLSPAGKTGTSNDSRDSWFAGWTGDHLAVIWVGNDQNESTGLYGGTGAMRVWSNIFLNLPSAPLKVGDDGLDWQWVVGSNSTDAGCAGARRFAFVQGFAPEYAPCPLPEPEPEQISERGGWRDWFGFGRDRDEQRQGEAEPVEAPTP
jgi:penicillin-binding protein 1B